MTLASPPRVHRSVSSFRVATILFLAITCLKVWTGGAQVVAQSSAQLPDPALQRQELLTEVRRTNQLLTDIMALLKSGTLHVHVESADNQAD